MKTYIIRLEHHDDAASIRDKMSWSKAARILLAFPRRRIPALRTLDLNLIQREAVRLGGQMALVTRDADIAANAATLGIPVFSSIPEAQRLPWSRPRQKKHIDKHENRLAVLITQREEFRPKAESASAQWLRISGFILGMAGIFTLVLFFLPTATITVDVQTLDQSLTLNLWASPDISSVTTNGGVPARMQTISVEGSLAAMASGTTTVADTQSKGNLTLTNMTDTEVSVPAGTVFLSETDPPNEFESLQAVTIPAGRGQSTQVDIMALTAGNGGNVGADTIKAIEGSIGLLISASNPEPTSGGSNHSLRAASEQDYNQLYDALLTTLSEEAIRKLTASMEGEQILIPSSLKLDKIVRDERIPLVGEPADTIRLNLNLEFTTLSVQKSDVERAVLMAMDAGLPYGYTAGTNGFRYSSETIPATDANGNVYWKMKALRTIAPVWNLEKSVKMLAGQPLSRAEALLADQVKMVGKPSISIFPSFWKRLPYLPFRIHLVEK